MAAKEGEFAENTVLYLLSRSYSPLTLAVPAIQVTLRCTDKLDEYDTRTLTLRPGAVIQIGRASKNSAKPELMIGPGNAYIDSPTISREHAVLTATSPPAPCVYITDKGSMHGTMVNGNKLEPQKAHRLSNGDELQFGANVARENRTSAGPHQMNDADIALVFYTSRSFTFQSSLPSYPKGFSVPDDVETSDEEDVEVDEGLSCSPHYGTQAYPVTLDEGNVSNSQKAQVELIEDQAFPDEVDLEFADTTRKPCSLPLALDRRRRPVLTESRFCSGRERGHCGPFSSGIC